MNVTLQGIPKARVVLFYPLLGPGQYPVWAPLDQFAIATALLHAGFEVTLLDDREGPVAREKLIASLEGALFVGLGTKIGDQLRNTLELAKLCKQHRPDVPVVVGGWFPSLFPHALFEVPDVDLVVIGPGDESIVEVADRMLAGRDMNGVAGVWARHAGGVLRNPFGHLPDIRRTHPIPWREVGIARYMHPGGWINYFSSRGCPGECTFCSIYCLDPRRWTALPPDRVIADLEQLVALGFRGFQIMDTDFCADLRRVEAICRGIVDRGWQIRLHLLGRHSTLVRATDEQLRLMRAAGVTEIEMGIESGSQRLSDMVRKKINLAEVPATVRRLVGHGIRMKLNFLFGLPSETKEDLITTVRYIQDLLVLGDDAVGLQLFRYVPLPSAAGKDDIWNPRREDAAPMSLRELLEMPVIEEENADMPWLSPRQARDVNLAYFIYAPLALIPAVVSRSAGGRVWQAVLRALRPLARWRLRHGVYWFPFEKWLNNRFGYPMRHSSHEAFGPERDLPPAPLMGEALDPRPPLEPSSVA